MSYKNKEIIIIGAGPAGLLSAYLLSDIFKKITLVDRLKYIKRKACGEYLCPRGVELLSQLQILDKFEEFNDLIGMRIISPQETEVETHFPELSNFKFKGLSLNREVFEKKLLQLVRGKSNIDIEFNFTVNEVLRKKDFWSINSLDNKTVSGDILIAADGRSSIVAKKLGHLKAVKNKRVALHCYLTKKRDSYDRFGEMHILKNNSYCGINPIDENEVNFSIVCDNTKVQKFKNKRELIIESINSSNLLKSKFNIPPENEKVNLVFPLNAKNSFVAGDNLVYVGDSAGFIDPLTGEGIYNALKSSVLLYESIQDKKDITKALMHYKRKKNIFFFQKTILNNFFQFVIKKPWLCELIANFLARKRDRGDAFVGIVGNIYSPLQGAMRLLVSRRG